MVYELVMYTFCTLQVEFEGILANDPGKHLSIDNIIISVKRCLLAPTNAVSNTSGNECLVCLHACLLSDIFLRCLNIYTK